MAIKWITPPGSLYTAVEEEYVEIKLDAFDTSGSSLRFKIISGKLRNGLQLFNDGLVQGIPVIEDATADENYTSEFTVRATNQQGVISDRTFSITVTKPALPIIYPKNTSLGTYYDGYNLHLQLRATDSSPDAVLEWITTDGEIPLGTTLSKSGLLSGYIYPIKDSVITSQLGWNNARWDTIGWDAPTTISKSKVYYFSVRVFDGTRYDETRYSITVLPKSAFTVDNTNINASNDSMRVDVDNKASPFITTVPSDLPPIRQQSNFAFKIQGMDLDGDELEYLLYLSDGSTFDQGPTIPSPYIAEIGFDEDQFDQSVLSIPGGLTLDLKTGWLTGEIEEQPEVSRTYTFYVFCRKANDHLYMSALVSFELVVLGDTSNNITWITPEQMGVIDNGSISEFSVQAVSSRGKLLRYMITSGSPSRLPQGLLLLPDGVITGRVSFEYFTFDNQTTTIDGGSTTFDQEYHFTVTAIDIANTVSAERRFTINVSAFNELPYENLYLKALTTRESRALFNNIINNTSIFPSELIYRSSDLYFGVAKDIRFLFAAGIGPSELPNYINAMDNNHYRKRLTMRNVKSAVALDENFDVKYEIVYVDLSDSATSDGESAPNTINITAQHSTQYRNLPYNTLYPNSLKNMKDEISQVGYANRGAIPQWMVNQQEDGSVLGFTNAVVLAYTIPGASKLIAYRLRQSGFEFNDIDFSLDRYHLDNYLSVNYNIGTGEFVESTETTFDRLPPVGEGNPYAGSVDVAVTVPFDQINGRPLEYILLHGGLDGIMNIKDGQTLIFAKQEDFQRQYSTTSLSRDLFDQSNFSSLGFDLSIIVEDYTRIENDGWNDTIGRYGDTIDVDADGVDDLGRGYGMVPYSASTVIPGYLEKLVLGTPNQRSGIWEISLVNDVVVLSMIQEVGLTEYVQVAAGNSYGATKLYYDPIVKVNNSVPTYSVLTDNTQSSTDGTRFDGGGTRFYSNRDQHVAPRTNEQYLMFPKKNSFVRLDK